MGNFQVGDSTIFTQAYTGNAAGEWTTDMSIIKLGGNVSERAFVMAEAIFAYAETRLTRKSSQAPGTRADVIASDYEAFLQNLKNLCLPRTPQEVAALGPHAHKAIRMIMALLFGSIPPIDDDTFQEISGWKIPATAVPGNLTAGSGLGTTSLGPSGGPTNSLIATGPMYVETNISVNLFAAVAQAGPIYGGGVGSMMDYIATGVGAAMEPPDANTQHDGVVRHGGILYTHSYGIGTPPADFHGSPFEAATGTKITTVYSGASIAQAEGPVQFRGEMSDYEAINTEGITTADKTILFPHIDGSLRVHKANPLTPGTLETTTVTQEPSYDSGWLRMDLGNIDTTLPFTYHIDSMQLPLAEPGERMGVYGGRIWVALGDNPNTSMQFFESVASGGVNPMGFSFMLEEDATNSFLRPFVWSPPGSLVNMVQQDQSVWLRLLLWARGV